MFRYRRKDGIAAAATAGLILAAMLIAVPMASAQNLLKPGQGLVGAPQPIEEKPKDDDKPKSEEDGVTQLPQVDVNGKRDPLSEADRKLGKQRKALPGLGSDGKRKKGTAEKALDAYNKLEKDPNKLNPATQEFLDREVHAPDVNHADDYKAPLPRRDGEDYVDPIAAQQKAAGKK